MDSDSAYDKLTRVELGVFDSSGWYLVLKAIREFLSLIFCVGTYIQKLDCLF
jgi:hypothetical protein